MAVDLAKELERLTGVINRLQGRRDIKMHELSELGYNSVEDAEKALVKLQKDAEEAQAEYDRASKAFLATWGDTLQTFQA